MIALIGGIETGGEIRRDVVLRPLSGAAEMAIAELEGLPVSQPEKVSRFLAATVAELGGIACDVGVAASLSVGDRQHLVRQIGALLNPGQVWLTGQCGDCSADFDLPVTPAKLPVKPAGEAYPGASIAVEGITLTLRSPTGADQAAIVRMAPEMARQALLRRLAGLPDEAPLSAEAAARMEAVIEEMSPEVALEVASACPSCGAALRVAVDPYLALGAGGGDILEDVHVIAATYHWSEAQILALPRARRHLYLRLIDRARGVVAQADRPDGLH